MVYIDFHSESENIIFYMKGSHKNKHTHLISCDFPKGEDNVNEKDI